jgi:Asp/Glu/hydantoin racemase
MAQPIRVLVINGNTSRAITARLERHARGVASSATTVVATTAPFGPSYIQSRAEAAIAAHAILVGIARVAGTGPRGIDAAVIGCFGEPGLLAAREIFPFPVVGLAEAGMVAACQLGRRYAILTGGSRWPDMLRELQVTLGLDTRCASIVALPQSGLELARKPARAVLRILAARARELLRATPADVLVLGGAGLTGLAGPLQARLGVPVVDPLTAAIGQAEYLARLGARPSRSRRSNPGHPGSPLTTFEWLASAMEDLSCAP